MADDNYEDEQDGIPNQKKDRVIWVGRPSQWVNVIPILFYAVMGCVLGGFSIYLHSTKYAWEYEKYIEYYDYALAIVCGILILKGIYKVLSVFYTKYELTNERLIEFTGITSMFQSGDPLELYTIYDYKFPPPFLLALFGRGSLKLYTHDKNQPIVLLRAIKDKHGVYEMIRQRVEELRMSKKAYFLDPQ